MSHKPSVLGHAAGEASAVVSSNRGALLAVLHVFMTVVFLQWMERTNYQNIGQIFLLCVTNESCFTTSHSGVYTQKNASRASLQNIVVMVACENFLTQQ